jgi:hypothetical protein
MNQQNRPSVVSGPVITTDGYRLNEIYQLRILCWEDSALSDYINRKKHPGGLADAMDSSACHWCMLDNSDSIIAACRANLCEDLSNLSETYAPLDPIGLPSPRPFAFFSRLVVRRDWRGRGLAEKLTATCLEWFHFSPAAYGLTFSIPHYSSKLIQSGFRKWGTNRLANGNVSLPVDILVADRLQENSSGLESPT